MTRGWSVKYCLTGLNTLNSIAIEMLLRQEQVYLEQRRRSGGREEDWKSNSKGLEKCSSGIIVLSCFSKHHHHRRPCPACSRTPTPSLQSINSSSWFVHQALQFPISFELVAESSTKCSCPVVVLVQLIRTHILFKHNTIMCAKLQWLSLSSLHFTALGILLWKCAKINIMQKSFSPSEALNFRKALG